MSAVRQYDIVAAIARRAPIWPDVLSVLLVGSLAAGTGDAVSDVDLIVCVRAGCFAPAWSSRGELHVTGALYAWDDASDEEIACHRWVSDDVILCEALFATPDSGCRLAEPWRLIYGTAAPFPPRPPIDRAEFDVSDAHPVDLAFTALKNALRSQLRSRSFGGFRCYNPVNRQTIDRFRGFYLNNWRWCLGLPRGGVPDRFGFQVGQHPIQCGRRQPVGTSRRNDALEVAGGGDRQVVPQLS
jgi:hypothetical protein